MNQPWSIKPLATAINPPSRSHQHKSYSFRSFSQHPPSPSSLEYPGQQFQQGTVFWPSQHLQEKPPFSVCHSHGHSPYSPTTMFYAYCFQSIDDESSFSSCLSPPSLDPDAPFFSDDDLSFDCAFTFPIAPHPRGRLSSDGSEGIYSIPVGSFASSQVTIGRILCCLVLCADARSCSCPASAVQNVPRTEKRSG